MFEVLYIIIATIVYAILWVLSAYLIPIGIIGFLGFPLWFSISCIYLPILFIFFVVFSIIFVFKTKG